MKALLAALPVALLAAALLAPAEAPSVDLARATWTRNGLPPERAPVVRQDAEPAAVELDYEASGVRWACEFSTPDAGMRRLELAWRGAPDGLLFEVVLDGARLSPPRDGWRPSPRALRSDLGAAWLGRGAHVLEFVAREAPPDGIGRLRLAALELGEP